MPKTIPLSLIDATDNTNGRFNVDEEHVHSLARQIERDGLLHPITLKPAGARYLLAAGNHRLHAFKLLGRETIPAMLIDGDLNDAARIRLTENATRAAISPIEEASQLGPLVEAHPNGVEGVALDIGRSVPWILDRLDMLEWPDELLAYVHAKRISAAAAKHLVKIRPYDLRKIRIRDAAEHGCSARTAILWKQQADADLPPDFETPEDKSNPVYFPDQIQNVAPCAFCKQTLNLDNLQQVHICRQCYQAVSEIPPCDAPATQTN